MNVTEKPGVKAPQPTELHAWTAYVYVPSARPERVNENVLPFTVLLLVVGPVSLST
jgi:hypothetical protein